MFCRVNTDAIKAPKQRVPVAAFLFLAGVVALPGVDPASRSRNVDGIADNSFLIEEAYNQEAGVVQHIFTGFYNIARVAGPDDQRYDLSFTQEWPWTGRSHQIGYTVPYSFIRNSGGEASGIGDILLNYRYQAWFNEASLTALAPRLSLVLPTGNERRGLGEDTVGGQLNLPFSTALGDEWFVHLNAGATFLPEAASANDRDLWHFNLGGSFVYAATPSLHLLVECIGAWTEGLNNGGNLRHEFTAILSPGVRNAFNFSSGAQLVAGVASPIGLTDSAPDFGVFLYLSFEHSFLPNQ